MGDRTLSLRWTSIIRALTVGARTCHLRRGCATSRPIPTAQTKIWLSGGYASDGITPLSSMEIFMCAQVSPTPTPTATAAASATPARHARRSFGDCNGYGNGHSHGDCNCDCNCDCHCAAAAYTDATASADTAASPRGRESRPREKAARGSSHPTPAVPRQIPVDLVDASICCG